MRFFNRNSASTPSADVVTHEDVSLAQPMYSPQRSLSLELYQQTLALYRKTILLLWRSWMSTSFRAWTLPICYAIFMVSISNSSWNSVLTKTSRDTPNIFTRQTLLMVLLLLILFQHWLTLWELA